MDAKMHQNTMSEEFIDKASKISNKDNTKA